MAQAKKKPAAEVTNETLMVAILESEKSIKADLMAYYDKVFGVFDKKADKLDGRIDKLDNKIDKLNESLNGRIDKLDESLNGRIDKLDGRIDKLDGRIDRLEDKMDNHYKWTIGLVVLVLISMVAPYLQSLL